MKQKKRKQEPWNKTNHEAWLAWKREYYKKNRERLLKQTNDYWNRPENIERKREHGRKNQQKVAKKARAYDRLKAKGLI